MAEMLLEGMVLIFVIASVPAFVCALQKLTGRPFKHKLLILLLYVVIFSIYLEINERLGKNQQGEDVWLPKALLRRLQGGSRHTPQLENAR